MLANGSAATLNSLSIDSLVVSLMAQRIHHLDSLTINQIAAGEVIDVPASCVKELVENSLDAGATDILIEISLGGRELIRVTDNGFGMGREDVSACIERYSTSKLQHIDDLETLASRGFRGEALASIASIAHITITSAERVGDDPICAATTIVAEAGKILSVTDTKATPGTTVEVASLFFNVPARRKFLKSPAKDSQEIIKTVTCLAIASPHVAFRLIVDGRQVISVIEDQSEPLNGRIRALLKEPFQQEAFDVHHARDTFSLMGLVAAPHHARTTRSGQYLIVNGRYVVSLPISYAIKAAFGTTCEEGKHPLFALHLSLDPSSIDVNVHPQKREVRFADEEWVRMLVQEAVSEALFGRRGFAPAVAMPLAFSSSSDWAEPQDDAFSKWRYAEVETAPSLALEMPESSAAVCLAVIGDVALIQPPRMVDVRLPFSRDALLLLDLRQALRTVVFRELQKRQEPMSPELFLIPMTFDCSAQEAALVTQAIPKLEKMGVLVRTIGEHTFLIEGAPKPFLDLDLPKFCIDISHDNETSSHDIMNELFYSRIATLYVAAMKGLRPPISSELALSIFTRWSQSECPEFSIDGKPCYVQLTPNVAKEWVAKGLKR